MLTVLNDLHIGAIRSSGTSSTSAIGLRKYIVDSFAALINSIKEGDLLINGDMFDTFNCPAADLLATFHILASFLQGGQRLYISVGNHDIAKNSANLSSVEFLSKILDSHFQGKVILVSQPMMTKHGYIIPHLIDQDAFNKAVSEMPKCGIAYVHCNIDNKFAVESDHSLNLSPEQIKEMPCSMVVCAHEHQYRQVGKVLIPGNQIPTSISDCLGSEAKYYTVVKDGIPELKVVAGIRFWYQEIDWRETADVAAVDLGDWPIPCPDYPMFLRVTGAAASEEAAQVAQAIATLRRSVDSFVVGNAVKIESADGETLAQSLESLKAFDISGALNEFLTAEEVAKINSLK